METVTLQDSQSTPEHSADGGTPTGLIDAAVTRRGFLRGAALAGTGLVAATVAACAPAAGQAWQYATSKPLASGSAAPAASAAASAAPSAAASMSMPPTAAPSAVPSASAIANLPPGWSEHDINARQVVRRYLGKIAPALKGVYGDAAFAKLADILAAGENYPELTAIPEFAQVTQGNEQIAPKIVNGVKVFELTIDEIDHKIDATKAPLKALGYNKIWPGPQLRVTEGDTVQAVFTNNLKETTGVHFHGVEFEDFFQDGVPFVTQKPIAPGETFTYEFTATPHGSMMYHSHHNATDQVGRGLLAAFIVDPKDPAETYAKKFGVTQEYTWISNDTVGGFTINGHGFPAVVPIVAAKGEKVLVRFMNEGIMMHPWHLHGYRMRVVARDGARLGTAEFFADTLGVNPGERYDVIVDVDRPGVWAFHCHILPHVEGTEGMFGMVNTLIVTPTKVDLTPLLT
jgi:manganese oxidase